MIIYRFIRPQQEAKKYHIRILIIKNSFYSVIQTNKNFQGFERLDVSRKYSSSSVPAVHVQANNIGHYRCLDYNATKPVHNRDHSSNHRKLFWYQYCYCSNSWPISHKFDIENARIYIYLWFYVPYKLLYPFQEKRYAILNLIKDIISSIYFFKVVLFDYGKQPLVKIKLCANKFLNKIKVFIITSIHVLYTTYYKYFEDLNIYL